MKSKLIRISSRLIKTYKPIDSVLRNFFLYKKTSEKLHSLYVSYKNQQRKDIQYYIDNHDKISVIKKTILLDSFWGRKLTCNPYALYRAFKKDSYFDDYKYIWVRNKNVATPLDVLKDKNVSYVEYSSLEHSKALLEAEIIISNSNLPLHTRLKENQFFINPWHGIPIKTLGLNADSRLVNIINTQKNFNSSDLIISANEYTTEKIINAYNAKIGLEKVYEIGSPRIDLTIAANASDVRSKLGIKDDKKILLFAPTWRGYVNKVSTEIDMQIAACKSLEKAFGETHHILVSLHNYTRAKIGQTPNIRHVPDDVDINEILAAVDTLVSDYSSIFVDYMVLDRPIILYTPDYDEYLDDRGLYIPLEQLPVSIAHNLDELIHYVKINKKPSSFHCWDKTKNTLISNEDGKACERSISIIKNRKNNEYVNKKKKIIIYPGGLYGNGITASAINLLSNINYDTYDVFVLLDAYGIDRNSVRNEMFKKIDPRANYILWQGRTSVPSSVKKEYFRYLTGKSNDSLYERNVFNSIVHNETLRFLRNKEFDVAIDFSGYSLFWNTFISLLNAKVKIVYQHSDLFAEINNPKKNMTDLLPIFHNYKNYDKVISVSPELMEVNRCNLSSYYGEKTKVGAIENSLNIQSIKNMANTPLGLTMRNNIHLVEDPNLYKFISIGRLSTEKNISRLLKAFSKVVAKKRDCVLFIVGSGKEEKALKNLAFKLGVSNNVVFTGRLSNPLALLKQCDCYILSSDYEGQPMVLLEALTLGKTCISTELPSTITMLENNKGILCRRNSDALANAMLKEISSPIEKPIFDADQYNRKIMNDFHTEIQPN